MDRPALLPFTVGASPRGAEGLFHPRAWILALLLLLFWSPAAQAAKSVFHSVELRDLRGNPVTMLTPADTFTVDVTMSDADGFRDIASCELGIWYLAFPGYGAKPWQGTALLYDRDASPHFYLSSKEYDWTLVQSLCSVDTLTNTTAPVPIRFAFVVSRVARAAPAPSWEYAVWTRGVSQTQFGWGVTEYVEVALADSTGVFTAAAPGAASVPLITPADGKLHFQAITNTLTAIEGRGEPLVGLTNPAARIPVGGDSSSVRWSLTNASGSYSGPLDSVFTAVGPALQPNTESTPVPIDLYLTARYPGVPGQTYRGKLYLRGRGLVRSTLDSASLLATVTSAGSPADSVRAEVHPSVVTAGTPDQPFVATLRPFPGPGSTGINWIRVAVPRDYGPPAVTAVRVRGVPVAFTDTSDSSSAIANLSTAVADTSRIEVDFRSAVQTAVDGLGADFVVSYSNTVSSITPSRAIPGDANGIPDGDGWSVVVVPGPLANLTVIPRRLVLDAGKITGVVAFTTDAYGNPVSASVSWSVEGGIGIVDSTGAFRAATPGTGRIIAQSTGLADTVDVDVYGVHVVTWQQTPRALRPLLDTAEVFRLSLTNEAADPETLTTLRLANSSVGPGTIPELDASWTPLTLSLVGAPVNPLASSSMSGGNVAFSGLAVVLDPGGTTTLVVQGAASATARDGDQLDLRAADASTVTLHSFAQAAAPWPLAPAGGFLVDGMTSAQIVVTPVAGQSLRVGTSRNPVMEVVVPSNGYAADVLQRINVVQHGTAMPGSEIARMEAWADDGDGLFNAGQDFRLGGLTFTGDRWELTGLARPVPPPGLRVFITADISMDAVSGKTIRLSLPAQPDPSLLMSSQNDGPMDGEVGQPADLVITSVDRITLASDPIAMGTVRPGAREVPLLAMALTNSYAFERRLETLTLTNGSAGPGTTADLDGSFAQVFLRVDGDGDGTLGSVTVDPVLAVGAFEGGSVTFAGLDWTVSAGLTRTLFLTADVSLSGAADGDRLLARLQSPADLVFDSTTVVTGIWPIASGDGWTVDGMISEQIRTLGSPGGSLAPGDGPVVALDLVIPRNGYRDDTLRALRLANTGSASASDIAELRLWRDGGDGLFGGPTSDDRDLGPLLPSAGEWSSLAISEPLGPGGGRFFVSLSVASSPVDSTTVLLRVPADGITVESGNDGPADRAIDSPTRYLISSGPILATLTVTPGTSTIGQNVLVRLRARNASPESILGIVPAPLSIAGTGGAVLVAGPTPATCDLAPGAEETFEWTYSMVSAGDLRWSGQVAGTGATSGLPRTSLNVTSNAHVAFLEAEAVGVYTVESMPFAVNRGQDRVVPLAFTFNQDSPDGTSGILVRGLRLRIESETGAGIVPAALLSVVRVLEGANVYLAKTSLETSGNTLDLNLATPALVRRGEPLTLVLSMQVSSTTTVPSFRLVIADSTGIWAEDETSGAPVHAYLVGQAYPVRSGLARVVASATALDITCSGASERRVSQGQGDVSLGTLDFLNTGVDQISADVRVGSLAIRLIGCDGQVVPDPGLVLDQIRVSSPFQTFATRTLAPSDTGSIWIDLVPQIAVPVNTPVAIQLLADLKAGAATGCYRFRLTDSTNVEARDGNTGTRLPVRLTPNPLIGDSIRIEQRADSLVAQARAEFPRTATIGQHGLDALTLALRHPGTDGVARIRVDRLVLVAVDEGRRTLAPATWMEDVHVLWRGVEVGSAPSLPTTAGPVPIPIAPVYVEPSSSESLTVVVDIVSTAPKGFLEVLLDPALVGATDANLNTPVRLVPGPGAVAPFGSGLTELETPARTLVATLESAVPPAVPPDGAPVLVGRLVLNNPDQGSGGISVDHVVIDAGAADGGAIRVGSICDRLEARFGGAPWGASGTLTSDSTSAVVTAGSAVTIPAGQSTSLELWMIPRSGAMDGRFRLCVGQSGVGVVQPQSALLSVAVIPGAGQSFPLWSESFGFVAGSLRDSYSNYPNPFAAGRERTTFVYYLPEAGHVSLRIFTLNAEPVATLLEHAPAGAGLHQVESWDGRNGRGSVVRNGVYVAELIVERENGSRERILRKVAVVR